MLSEAAHPVAPLEPIDVKDHDKTASRYPENQRTCCRTIFSRCLVHVFSLDISGCEQFSCERYRRYHFNFDRDS